MLIIVPSALPPRLGGRSWPISSTAAFGMLICGPSTSQARAESKARSERAVAYRATRQDVQPYPNVSGSAPTRNAPFVPMSEVVRSAKAQRSGRTHRSPVGCRLLCDPPRCATRPARGSVPECLPFLPIGMPYSTQRPAQHGIAADRFARAIVGF
jgi:hypothetical protein